MHQLQKQYVLTDSVIWRDGQLKDYVSNDFNRSTISSSNVSLVLHESLEFDGKMITLPYLANS